MLIDGEKWACESCVRGHRVGKCKHNNRPLQHIERQGRPASKCLDCQANSIEVCRHMHTFVCNFPRCTKKFTRGDALSRHEWSHRTPRFVCDGCNFPAFRLDMFQRHKKNCERGHPNGPPATTETRAKPPAEHQGAPPAPSISNKDQLSLDAVSAISSRQPEPPPAEVPQPDLGAPPTLFLEQASSLFTPTLLNSTSTEKQLSPDTAFPTFGLAEVFWLDWEQLDFAEPLMSTHTSSDGTSDGEQLTFADWSLPRLRPFQ